MRNDEQYHNERYDHDSIIRTSGYVDLNGNPVKRTPINHPYTYDFYVQWVGGNKEEINSVVYSDRLWQWDYKKYNTLMEKHFGNQGQIFYDVNPTKMQSFLRDYMDDQELELIAIMQGCNVSSGFPLWTFHFKTKTA